MMRYPEPEDIGGMFVQFGGGLGRWGFSSINPILYYGKDPYLAKGMGCRPNSWMVTDTAEKNGHPCPKPINFMLKIVNRVSWKDETILDPFMGSGTTGVACMNLGRKFIGIEIEPKYFDIACKRIREAWISRPRLFEEAKKPEQGILIDGQEGRSYERG